MTFGVGNNKSLVVILQGQFLLENIVDKERKYEFPLELEVCANHYIASDNCSLHVQD
jgi:hypothetical protein